MISKDNINLVSDWVKVLFVKANFKQHFPEKSFPLCGAPCYGVIMKGPLASPIEEVLSLQWTEEALRDRPLSWTPLPDLLG